MMVKRSRICRSLSSGETTVLPTSVNRPPPKVTVPNPVVMAAAFPDERFRNSVATADNRRQKPGMFMVSSPVRESVDRRGEDVLQKYCGFLEKCCYCRQKILNNRDIFMYRDLRAFCSEECRQKQIDIDEDLKTLCVNPRAKRVNNNQTQFYNKQQRGGY